MHKVGRNDPCPCGSGKKYKKCCELKEKHKKFHAEVLSSSAPQDRETKDTSRVSSLFFKQLPAPKQPAQEPPNPVM
jgi:hypothetical protein